MAVTESAIQSRSTIRSHSGGRLARLLAGLRLTVAELRRRRCYRNDLQRLLRAGPYMIADVGLTLEAARREIEKPLWRP